MSAPVLSAAWTKYSTWGHRWKLNATCSLLAVSHTTSNNGADFVVGCLGLIPQPLSLFRDLPCNGNFQLLSWSAARHQCRP